MASSVAHTQASQSELAKEISRGIVGLYKRYTGRGPSFARTHLHEELVVTVLTDTLTQGELTLKGEGRGELVRQQRRVFQSAFRNEAIAMVERLSGRSVLSFLSDHAVDPDHAIEAFVLAPGDGLPAGDVR